MTTTTAPTADLGKMKSCIDKAKINLCMKYPFYSYIMLKYGMIERKDIPLAATDGKHIFLNREGLSDLTKYNDEVMLFVLAHEIHHIAFGHIPICKMNNFNPKVSNYAQDYVINQVLLESGIGMPPTVEKVEAENLMAKKGFKFDTFVKNGTTYYSPILFDETLVKKYNYDWVAIYHHLMNDKKHHCHTGSSLSGLLDSIIDEIENDQHLTPEEKQAAIDDAKSTLAAAVQAARMRGKMPAGLERFITEFLEPKVSWKEVLARFATQLSPSCERGYLRPNRKLVSLGGVFPSQIEQETVGDIIVCVDTSGSCQGFLEQFCGEINGIRQTHACKLRVLYCDCAVQKEDIFEPEDNLTFDTKGGGGSSVEPAAAHVNDLLEVSEITENSILIFLTDLDVHFGDTVPAIPSLFIVQGGNKSEPPYGERVSID